MRVSKVLNETTAVRNGVQRARARASGKEGDQIVQGTF